MMNRLSYKLAGLPVAAFAAVVMALPLAATPVAAQTVAATPPVLQLNTGRGRLITLPAAMTDVFVANDAVADVQVRSPTQLYVFAKGPGETTISATSRSGAVVYAATVRVGNNIESIQGMLGLAMPEASVVATPMNGLILLTGTVANPDDAAEAERLVQAFVGEDTKVISRLKVATPLQVSLHVRIAEVSRTFVKNVGVNLQTFDPTSGFKFGITQGRAATQFAPGGPLAVGGTNVTGGASLVEGGTGSTLGLAGRLLGLDILSSLDVGETIGQVSTLASPNLTALSGETATFLAGGEIPVLVPAGIGSPPGVEYKQYGISLAYTPTVLGDGRISLRVRPEVSQLSASGAVSIGGTQIPAFTTRRAETTVELGSGESYVIAGLLSNSHDNTIDKTPFLGDIPILGALFRSNGFRRSETELVIVVTPYLVRPVDASRIVLPTDGYRAPTDAGRILMGELQSGTTGGSRPKPTMAPAGTVAPGIGVAAPLPAGPSLPAPADAAKAPAPRKAASAAPGFSN